MIRINIDSLLEIPVTFQIKCIRFNWASCNEWCINKLNKSARGIMCEIVETEETRTIQSSDTFTQQYNEFCSIEKENIIRLIIHLFSMLF